MGDEMGMKDLVAMLKKQDLNLNKRLDELTSKIDNVNSVVLGKLKDLEERIDSHEKSAEFINNQYESQKQMTESVIKDQMKLEQVNADLTKEIIELKKDFKKQGSELNNLQQYSRRECIEINGVPPTDDENTEEIVIHICKEIGVTVEKSDVVACHRVKTSKGDPYIITKFLNRKTKENVMRNRKNLKHKTVERLGFPAEENKKQNKVFINESLTPRNKNLFRLVRLKADEMKWEFYWTKNGTVYAKKNENTAPAKISDFEDIAKKII